MEFPSVCNLHFSADFQGAETVWSYTLKESCGSPETDRVGLHRVSKHWNTFVNGVTEETWFHVGKFICDLL